MMQNNPEGLLSLLEQHLSWYPVMEPRDIYKLLYQGVMGSEHLLTTAEEYTQYLHYEFETLQPEVSQAMLEPVRPDGALFRLNLRPYKSHLQSIDILTPTLLESARIVFGNITELRAVWESFVQYCHQGRIHHFDTTFIHQFSGWLDEVDYPAVHHSEAYRRAYQPAYRLISAKFIPELGLNDAG